MTVKEWKQELSFYDDDAEVVFEFDDEIEPESVTEDRFGRKEVHIDSKLKESFICVCGGNCLVELSIKEEEDDEG